MKIFSYYKKIFAFVLLTTLIAITIHIIACIDIRTFKMSVSHVTKNYQLFKYIYPILYIILSINICSYAAKFENSKYIYLIAILYILLIVLTLLSTILGLRFAKFIFSFWLIITCIILDSIILYILYIHSSKLLYFGGIHLALYSYLGFVNFWLYFQNI